MLTNTLGGSSFFTSFMYQRKEVSVSWEAILVVKRIFHMKYFWIVSGIIFAQKSGFVEVFPGF